MTSGAEAAKVEEGLAIIREVREGPGAPLTW
jgi:hypothetical protein